MLKKNRGSSSDLYLKYKVVNLDTETFNKEIEISDSKTPF